MPDDFNGRLTGDVDWRNIVQLVSDLPPLPRVAMEAMKILDDPEVTPVRVTDLICQDASLASRLLKIANSAMFARRSRVSTLTQAVMMVGFKTLKGLLLAATLRDMLRSETEYDKFIWSNSMLTAITAGSLCRELNRPFFEETFTYGLLHDVGKLVLLSTTTKTYKSVLDGIKEGKTFVEVEQEHLGYTHALIGALVTKKWNFPTELCQVLLHHHDPIELKSSNTQANSLADCLGDELALKTAIVQAANLVSHAVGVGHPEGYPEQGQEATQRLLDLGLTQEAALAFIEETQAVYAMRTDSIFGE